MLTITKMTASHTKILFRLISAATSFSVVPNSTAYAVVP
jgi:hypothetical protein